MDPVTAYAVGMRISFSTGTYYHFPLGFSLSLARQLGYDGVEWVVHPGYLLHGLETVQAAFRRSGVRALSVHPPLRRLPGWPRRASRAAARLGALARHLGAELFVVHTALFHSLHSPRALRYAEALDLGRLAGGPRVGLGIEIGQHTKRRRYLLDDLAQLTAFCRAHECGITLDTCHVAANGDDLLASYRAIRPLLRNVHLSDVVWQRGRPHTHRLPGEGELPLDTLLAAMASDGYDGLITIELHPLQAGPISRAQAARRLGKALEFVRTHTACPPATTGGGGQQVHAAEE